MIVSGGQTGVDRGALDAALARGFPCGGWCPEGRRAEDGVIPERYPMRELPGGGYRERTIANVRDADATLIIHSGAVSGGTRLTLQACEKFGRPSLCVDAAAVDVPQAAAMAAAFLAKHRVGVLNVAGPRESGAPRAAAYAERVISLMLRAPGLAERSLSP
jgi:hypothetical protein